MTMILLATLVVGCIEPQVRVDEKEAEISRLQKEVLRLTSAASDFKQERDQQVREADHLRDELHKATIRIGALRDMGRPEAMKFAERGAASVVLDYFRWLDEMMERGEKLKDRQRCVMYGLLGAAMQEWINANHERQAVLEPAAKWLEQRAEELGGTGEKAVDLKSEIAKSPAILLRMLGQDRATDALRIAEVLGERVQWSGRLVEKNGTTRAMRVYVDGVLVQGTVAMDDASWGRLRINESVSVSGVIASAEGNPWVGVIVDLQPVQIGPR